MAHTLATVTDGTCFYEGEVVTAAKMNQTIQAMIQERLENFDAGIAVVKCAHCGQWGARYCACPKCGAPID